MLMVMGQNKPTTAEYIPQSSQGVSKRAKILVVVMIVGVLILVIGGFMFARSRKDPNLVNAENLVAIHAEIARVSDLAIDTDQLSADGKDLAATAKAIASSNQGTMTVILTDAGGKADKKLLASRADQANDDKIKQGQLLGDVDKAYKGILKTLLIESNVLFGESSGNQEVQEKIKQMSESNEKLFNSIDPSS